MKINKPKTQKPRTEPIKFGEESHGRRKLIRAVMERGFSQRTAAKAVDTIIRVWTQALQRRESVEMPIGRLRVRTTSKTLYKKRHTRRVICGKPKGRLISWTVYNNLYTILWRMPPEEWDKLLDDLNHKDHS
jgi:nucleoid DNA-binding protein